MSRHLFKLWHGSWSNKIFDNIITIIKKVRCNETFISKTFPKVLTLAAQNFQMVSKFEKLNSRTYGILQELPAWNKIYILISYKWKCPIKQLNNNNVYKGYAKVFTIVSPRADLRNINS